MKVPSFSFSPKQSLVFATVLLLIIPAAAYFLWYVPQQQSALEQKQFRCLQSLEMNIRDKIANSLQFLNTMMDDRQHPIPGYSAQQVDQYIDYYSQKNLRQKNFRLNIKKLLASPKSGTTSLTGDTTLTLNENVLSIRLRRGNVMIEMTYTLKQFIEPLLRRDLFDNYLLLHHADVIYQTFPSGMAQLASDSLKSDKSAFNRNQIKDISLGGTDYKLFSQQIILQHGAELTIAGLLSKESYDAEKNRLPGEAVFSLFTLVLSLILALPWIKLYQMGSRDRLTVTDGVLCLSVPMLLTSVLFFILLQYSKGLRNGVDAFETAAQHMSGRIDDSITKEARKTYVILRKADSVINLRGPFKTVKGGKPGFSGIIQRQLAQLNDSVRINQIVQLDSEGKERQNWSPHDPAAPPGDYSDRDYFKKLKRNDPFYLDNHEKQPYVLQPVVSRITGKFTTVMCIRTFSSNKTFTVISFDLKSLDQPILTPGFQYAVIDDNGQVLYHSDTAKQLNENLFTECSEQERLSAAVHAHLAESFSAAYAGKDYRVFVHPVRCLPFSIVIMESDAFAKNRLTNQFVFSFTMLFGYFIVLGLELLVLFAVSVKPAHYKKHYFDISWIGPNERFHTDYNLTFYCNIFIIFILVLFWSFHPSFLQLLFIFLSSANLCYLFQNSLYAVRYYREGSSRFRLKCRGIVVMSGMLALLDAVACFIVPLSILITFQLTVTFFLGTILVLYCYTRLLNQMSCLGARTFSLSFTLMTFSRLIITSGLPVILFFIAVYNYDLKQAIRYRQSGFIKSVLARGVHDMSGLDKLVSYADGVWIESIAITGKMPGGHPALFGDSIAGVMFRQLAIDNIKIPGIGAMNEAPADSAWEYTRVFGPGPDTTWSRLPDKRYFQAWSQRLNYNMPKPQKGPFLYRGIVFWLLVPFVLGCFLLVFYDVIKRLFALNLPTDKGWAIIDDVLLNTDPLNKLIFLIGAPGSGKLAYVKQLIEGGKITGKDNTTLVYKKDECRDINYFIADMILTPNDEGNEVAEADWTAMKKKAMDKRYKLVIINQFEYDIKNPASNRAKLTLLEDILQKNTAKVIIISTVHPVNFLDSLNQPSGTVPDDSPDKKSPGHELERWHVLLGHFRIVIRKLDNDYPVNLTRQDWQSILAYETRSGELLKDMKQPVLDNAAILDEAGINGDSLTLKMGITAHYFYMYLWQSLTKEEKFILYDLAEDGLVNPFDDYNLVLLITKGIIVRQDGVLRLFNQGFRDFIMTAIGPSEALLIQREIKDNGNWGKLKSPLILLIVCLLVFLFASQKETYANVLKYLAVITGGVPLITQVFSFFKSDSSVASKS